MIKILKRFLGKVSESPGKDTSSEVDGKDLKDGVTLDEDFKPSLEIISFMNSTERLLEKFEMKLIKSYLKTEILSYRSSPIIKTFHFIFTNKIIDIEFLIYESDSLFSVDVYFSKSNSMTYKDRFSIYNFTDITECSVFKCEETIRGAEYYNLFGEYLKNLFHDEVIVEILNGKYWFDFYMHPRDQEYPIHLELRKEFLKSRKG